MAKSKAKNNMDNLLTREESKRIREVGRLCDYLEGGDIDTSDIRWLVQEYKALKGVSEDGEIQSEETTGTSRP